MIDSSSLSRLLTLLRSPSVFGIAKVFLLKGATVVLTFALITLAARGLGEHDFGVFSTLFSAAGLFSIFAAAGQQMLLMRSWNEYAGSGDASRLKGGLRFGIAAFALASTIIGSMFFIGLCLFFAADLAAATVLYMLTLGLVLTTAHLVRTAVGVGIGDGFGNLLVPAFPIVYLLACLLTGTPAQTQMVLWLFSLGAAIAIAIHIVVMHRRIRTLFPNFDSVVPLYDIRPWAARSVKLWISNGLEASNQYLDVVLIGLLMSPSVTGAYFVTTRLANAFATASDAMHMFSTRHIPELYFRGQRAQLDALLNTVATITLAVIAGGMVVILGGGHFLLAAFNEAYTPYYSSLALLCLGTATVAAVGPSGSILMLTGHEGSYLNIITITVVLRAIGFILLVPYLGVAGAVAATTISFIVMAVLLRNSAILHSGIDGSIARLLPTRLGGARPVSAK